jgi:predicted DNA-binding protein
MTGFSSTELPEEFKQRLNSLSEKLNRINGNLDQSPNNTEAAA